MAEIRITPQQVLDMEQCGVPTLEQVTEWTSSPAWTAQVQEHGGIRLADVLVGDGAGSPPKNRMWVGLQVFALPENSDRLSASLDAICARVGSSRNRGLASDKEKVLAASDHKKRVERATQLFQRLRKRSSDYDVEYEAQLQILADNSL